MDQENSQGLDRRSFMQRSAAVAGAAALGSSAAKAAAPDPAAKKKPGDDGLIHRNEREGMTYAKLGRTNFMASQLVFGCGAALSGGKAVRLLDNAFEAGINFYDIGTDWYYKGSERYFAPFLKEHRDDIWVSSKAPVRAGKDYVEGAELSVEEGKAAAKIWTKLLEGSLKDLDTDYVDAYYLMMVGEPSLVKSEEVYQAFLDAKAAGKVGHFGVSTHKRAEQVLAAMVETGWYDLAMLAVTPAGWYDWDSKGLLEGTPPLTEIRPALDRARDSGIGLVGMKAARYISGAMSGGKNNQTAFDEHYDEKLLKAELSPFQRTYAYVLQHGLDVVNADMQNFKHFEENLAAIQNRATYFA